MFIILRCRNVIIFKVSILNVLEFLSLFQYLSCCVVIYTYKSLIWKDYFSFFIIFKLIFSIVFLNVYYVIYVYLNLFF